MPKFSQLVNGGAEIQTQAVQLEGFCPEPGCHSASPYKYDLHFPNGDTRPDTPELTNGTARIQP